MADHHYRMKKAALGLIAYKLIKALGLLTYLMVLLAKHY